MKRIQIIILLVVVTVASAKAQQVEFEYNEFGERVIKTSPSTIDVPPVIKEETIDFAKKVVSYHPNPIIDCLEIELKTGTYRIIVADVAGKVIRHFDDVSEKLMIDFSDCASGAYIIKVLDNVNAESFKVIKQ